MTDTGENWYDRVYAAETDEETAAAYAGWAATYEADLYEAGYRGPPLAAALLARYAPEGTDPVLDAAAGTGMVGDLIGLLGFENITGIDLSDEMLKVAAGKGVYSELRTMRLGDDLDFADDRFAATLIVGALTPGHAPASCLYELVRVTRPGGPVIFSVRVDNGSDAPFRPVIEDLEGRGQWRFAEQTPEMTMMPLSEPDKCHRVCVYVVS
ncbi:MAG: class I SAM-dependent DNA methyltransferase [Rhodospirillales bacterium]